MISALIFSAISVAPHISAPHFTPPVRVAPAPVVRPAPAPVRPTPAPVIMPVYVPPPHITAKCDDKKEKCK
jgi:hypothetical protein